MGENLGKTGKSYSFLFHSIAIYAIYTFHSLIQEHLLSVNKSFSLLIFILFIQSIVGATYSFIKCPRNLSVRAIALKKSHVNSIHKRKHPLLESINRAYLSMKSFHFENKLLRQYVRISVLKMVYTLVSYSLIKKMSFPVLMVMKSTKVIPLVMLKCIVHGKRDWKQILKAIMVSLGVWMFVRASNMDNNHLKRSRFPKKNIKSTHLDDTLGTSTNIFVKKYFEGGNKFGDNEEKNHNIPDIITIKQANGHAHSNIPEIMTQKHTLHSIPIFILMMLLDTLKNHFQDTTFQTYNIQFYHMMYSCNLITSIFAFIILLSSNQLFSLVIFKEKLLFLKITIFSLLSVMGQVVVYSMIEKYGSVNLSMIVVTRKIFSLLLSIVFFKHKIQLSQIFGIVFVFGSFGVDFLSEVKK